MLLPNPAQVGNLLYFPDSELPHFATTKVVNNFFELPPHFLKIVNELLKLV